MKFAIIGGGISGLSIANLLQQNGHNVIVFEACDRPGGLIKCKNVNGSLFHLTGGHVFNSKRQDVIEWFWSFFDMERDFSLARRNSCVIMSDGKEIPYPIENHAYMLETNIGKQIISDWIGILKDKNKDEAINFEDFLIRRFGKTLYDVYFKPYNEKVWQCDLTKVPLSWLEGKLPMPTVEEMLFNNIYHIKENSFVHSSFYYPLKGGSQFIADTIAKNLNIRYNSQVEVVSRNPQGRFFLNDETCDAIVFCGNIKQLPSLFSDIIAPKGFSEKIDQLKYHGTTSVFVEIKQNPYSWIYMPGIEHRSHRIICTGNFSSTNNVSGKMTATIEFTNKISTDVIFSNLLKIPLSPKYLYHHFEEYTYPIQDSDTRQMINQLKKELAKDKIYLCGRFAEWEYSNMDVCVGSAIDLAKEIG